MSSAHNVNGCLKKEAISHETAILFGLGKLSLLWLLGCIHFGAILGRVVTKTHSAESEWHIHRYKPSNLSRNFANSVTIIYTRVYETPVNFIFGKKYFVTAQRIHLFLNLNYYLAVVSEILYRKRYRQILQHKKEGKKKDLILNWAGIIFFLKEFFYPYIYLSPF